MLGRITRCSTRGFVGAVRFPEPDLPIFGAFCKSEAQRGQSNVIGLIYDINIEDDEFARQMASAENLQPEQLADGQYNRQLPIEFSAISVGYQVGEQYHYTLPPQPPLTLHPIYALTPQEVLSFTERLDFLPLLFANPTVPVDSLLGVALRSAAVLRSEGKRRSFLLDAGRECSRLLTKDQTRIDTLLRLLGSPL
jgi:hypothetical protein